MKSLILFFPLLILTSCGLEKRLPTVNEYYREIQGTWISTCFTLNNTNRIQEFHFNKNLVQFKETVYTDNTCSSVLYQQTSSAIFNFGNYADNILPRSIVILYHMDDSYLTPLSSAASTDFNTNSECGINSWQDQVAVNVSGRTCAGTDKPIPSKDTNLLNLIKIENGALSQGDDRCETNNTCTTISGQKYPTEFYSHLLLKQ